ncbi:GNAT family N-acetyltransferase [Bosea sp. TND4EK4]|uniref:GNAT family N-acetyltransferase n=2 Tax=unclassified Bosea (in: a-proteobacteria) TaxID=2653178 RepID=UPI001AECAB67|nr:GNAT family N-acetyltransferase [Bosea sp. TND4EK4]
MPSFEDMPPVPSAERLRDDPASNRFVLETDGGEAFAVYRRIDGRLVISHTEVPAALRGRGIGSRLAKAVFDHARSRGERIVPACSFIADWAHRHPDEEAVLAGRPTPP